MGFLIENSSIHFTCYLWQYKLICWQLFYSLILILWIWSQSNRFANDLALILTLGTLGVGTWPAGSMQKSALSNYLTRWKTFHLNRARRSYVRTMWLPAKAERTRAKERKERGDTETPSCLASNLLAHVAVTIRIPPKAGAEKTYCLPLPVAPSWEEIKSWNKQGTSKSRSAAEQTRVAQWSQHHKSPTTIAVL